MFEKEVEVNDVGPNPQSKFQMGPGEEVVVGLDAVGLYPSIKKEVAMEICREAARETDISIKHMNMLEATRLLVLTWPKEKVESSGIKE